MPIYEVESQYTSQMIWDSKNFMSTYDIDSQYTIMLFLVCWGTKRISCQIMDLVRILLKLYVLRVYTARWEFYLSLLLLVTLKLFVNCLYKLSLIRFILSLQLFPPILIANPIGSLFSQHRKDKEPFKALEIYPSQKNEI